MAEGMIPKHNSSTTPDMQVNVGDLIVDVNGIYGDSAKMLEQVASATDVTVSIKRKIPGAPAARPLAAEATAAAPSPVAPAAVEAASVSAPPSEEPTVGTAAPQENVMKQLEPMDMAVVEPDPNEINGDKQKSCGCGC